MGEFEKLQRISTGIKDLDEILGGFPVGRSILITGDAGSGKTIMSLQFAIKSAENGLRTVYITTEEDETDLNFQCNSFGWNIAPLIEDGRLKIMSLAATRAIITEAEIKIGIESINQDIERLLEEVPPDTRVLIIDNLGSHTGNLTPYEFRNRFDFFVYKLKERNITSLIILDSATAREFNEIALFSVYGAINLIKRENPYTGRRERVMDIVKMRSTRTPVDFIPYRIGENGIEIIEKVKYE
ncbi:MAG: AAA family ATPase [Methanobacteriales archaeon]|nr:AAA family ATPase [Methanobacteriales archaeon]MBC7118507.1 AAA family ATPase [Methanobacteriaceae archaeon]